MKDYSIEADINGAERIFHMRGYTWQDVQAQMDLAFKGHSEYRGVIEITELSVLPEKSTSTPTPQERPGAHSESDKLYWSYVRSNIGCYRTIDSNALADAFRGAQDEGCYTTSQLEAIAKVMEDAIIRTVEIEEATA